MLLILLMIEQLIRQQFHFNMCIANHAAKIFNSRIVVVSVLDGSIAQTLIMYRTVSLNLEARKRPAMTTPQSQIMLKKVHNFVISDDTMHQRLHKNNFQEFNLFHGILKVFQLCMYMKIEPLCCLRCLYSEMIPIQEEQTQTVFQKFKECFLAKEEQLWSGKE